MFTVRSSRLLLSSSSSSSSLRLSSTGQRLASPYGRVLRQSKSTSSASVQWTQKKSPGFLEWYSNMLDRNPLWTKGITSGLIAAMGDLLCQGFIEVDQDYSLSRTLRFSLAGALYIGPGIHVWYGALATRLAKGTSASAVMKRVALDQFAFAPFFLAGFLSLLWGMEGHDASVIPNRLADTLPDIVQANWILWIPAQVINFGFVPVKYQVLFNNSLGLVWNAYVSYSSQQKDEPFIEAVAE